MEKDNEKQLVVKSNYLTRSGLLEDVKLFNHYKQEAQEFINSDFDNEFFDVELKDIIIALNQIEGLATRFSCTGHDHEHHPQLGIHLVAHTEDALKTLQGILYHYNQHIDIIESFDLHLRMETMGLLCDQIDGIDFMYPVVSIENFAGPFTVPEYLDIFLMCINTALEKK